MERASLRECLRAVAEALLLKRFPHRCWGLGAVVSDFLGQNSVLNRLTASAYAWGVSRGRHAPCARPCQFRCVNCCPLITFRLSNAISWYAMTIRHSALVVACSSVSRRLTSPGPWAFADFLKRRLESRVRRRDTPFADQSLGQQPEGPRAHADASMRARAK